MYQKSEQKRHVALIQQALSQLGYALVPDGLYGSETTAAVRAFQQREALPVTGQVDALTWKRLMERRPDSQPGPYVLAAPAWQFPMEQGLWVELAQLLMGELSRRYDNIDAVPLTGVYDETTRQMAERIRKIWALPPGRSDQLDGETYGAIVALLA